MRLVRAVVWHAVYLERTEQRELHKPFHMCFSEASTFRSRFAALVNQPFTSNPVLIPVCVGRLALVDLRNFGRLEPPLVASV